MEKELHLKMWSDELSAYPEAINEVKMRYLYLTHRDVPGITCGHNYKSEFIGNRHPSRSIKAKVKTTAIYMGNVVGESFRDIIVVSGIQNEFNLGCTGFSNNSGGYDTDWNREIVDADWAD